MKFNQIIMEMKNLEKHLFETGCVEKGIIVSSNLIDKLEVYGFVNSCQDEIDEDMFERACVNRLSKGVINKDPHGQIVLAYHLCQSSILDNDKKTVTEIYPKLVVSKSVAKYNLEDLYVPSLRDKQLYQDIKSRKKIYDICNKFKKGGFPSNYKLEDGKIIIEAPKLHIKCLDNDGVTKSIGDNLIAVCRYLHSETGTMCYTQYNLNEVYVDDDH